MRPVSPEALPRLTAEAYLTWEQDRETRYVLVSQDTTRVDVFVDGELASRLEHAEDRLILASLDFSLTLAELYA